MLHTDRIGILRVATPLLLACLMAACGGNRPLPTEVGQLDDLMDSLLAEEIREPLDDIEDPNVLELRETANEMLRSASVYHTRAIEQADARKDENAVLLARIGLIYFGASENYFRSAEARDRLMDANRRFEEQRVRRNDYAERIDSENQLVALLETIQDLFEENQDLRRELATAESAARSENRALAAIQEARIQEREARGARADVYAGETFDRASATLARAQQYYADEEFEQAYQAGLEAVETYRRAAQDAAPSYMADQARVMQDPDNAALFEDAQRVFGDDAFADARGIVVVLPGLFADGSDDIVSQRRYLLEDLGALAREHDDFEIVVEGHTAAVGDAGANRSLSEARAATVRDALVEAGANSRRVETQAFGDTAPRYDNSTRQGQVNNDRAEVVFVID